jgi:hypothetical protein
MRFRQRSPLSRPATGAVASRCRACPCPGFAARGRVGGGCNFRGCYLLSPSPFADFERAPVISKISFFRANGTRTS